MPTLDIQNLQMLASTMPAELQAGLGAVLRAQDDINRRIKQLFANLQTDIADIQDAPTTATTMGAFGAGPNANAGVIDPTTQVLVLEPASGAFPGGISLLAQVMGAGNKSFPANTGLGHTTAPGYAADFGSAQTPTKCAIYNAGGTALFGFGVGGSGQHFISHVNGGAGDIWVWRATPAGGNVMELWQTGQLGISISPSSTNKLTVGGSSRLQGDLGFWQNPTCRCDLGPDFANEKLSMHSNGLGFGVQSGDLRAYLDANTSKFSWHATSGGASLMELSGLGVLSQSAPTVYKGTTGITAFAGGGQASATQLSAEVNFVTTVATAADSVKLLTAALGQHQVVFNLGANAANVYPVTGGAIDALGANNPYSLAAGASREFWGQSATQWWGR